MYNFVTAQNESSYASFTPSHHYGSAVGSLNQERMQSVPTTSVPHHEYDMPHLYSFERRQSPPPVRSYIQGAAREQPLTSTRQQSFDTDLQPAHSVRMGRSSLQLQRSSALPSYMDLPSPSVPDYSDSSISPNGPQVSAGWVKMSATYGSLDRHTLLDRSHLATAQSSPTEDRKQAIRLNKKQEMAKLYPCPYVNPFTKQMDCPETFTRASDARRHIATSHAQIEESWVSAGVLSPSRALALQRSRRVTCERCGKTFSRLDALFRHREGIGKNGKYCNPGRTASHWHHTVA
ncbi:hypothetical protein NEOLEDRAFT_227830 [Neolentinus lepideus HHB14362 ss-1]|uniref:C2H2-type domain-containing protein n=1 Tax=Neolentinus lepideus HHB14362 ss-1 TaxID=1314782 RepID=A0A165TE78_9AGAM|nr:hypothetical protein NEOLEDRAFT_227830 [Neolentinus lepideus HHB14362 ss-1]